MSRKSRKWGLRQEGKVGREERSKRKNGMTKGDRKVQRKRKIRR